MTDAALLADSARHGLVIRLGAEDLHLLALAVQPNELIEGLRTAKPELVTYLRAIGRERDAPGGRPTPDPADAFGGLNRPEAKRDAALGPEDIPGAWREGVARPAGSPAALGGCSAETGGFSGAGGGAVGPAAPRPATTAHRLKGDRDLE